MHGRDLVSVNKVNNALCTKLETKTLTVLFMDLNQGFVRLLCSGKIVLVLHKKMKMKSQGLWWQYRTGNSNDSCFLQAKKKNRTSSNFKNKTHVVQDTEHTFSSVWPFINTMLSHTPGHHHSQNTWLCPCSSICTIPKTPLNKTLYKSIW